VPYNKFSAHLRGVFGCRVHRVAVDGGFTCPNRDGTAGVGGCIYCDEAGSRAAYVAPARPIREQVRRGIERMRRRFKAQKFLVYFQPYSNTYGPVEQLRALYDEALDHPDVVGLMVGTRADCLGPGVLDLLAEYHRRTYFWLELGLQSVRPGTLEWIGRGHDPRTFLHAAREAKARGLRVCAHLILGLPTDKPADYLMAVDMLNWLAMDGLKLHCLYVTENSRLGKLFGVRPFPLPTFHEYVQWVCDILERLHPRVAIERLTSDVDASNLVGPFWLIDKRAVIEEIEAELARRGTRQGSRCQ
jgi:hypothetical protein